MKGDHPVCVTGVQEIADYNGEGVGAPWMLTVRGVGGLPVAAITPATSGQTESVAYYHHDVLGSTVAATQAGTSGPAEVYVYSDFGEPAGGSFLPYQFAGYRYDNETGLYYVRARYYSPTLGRFLQPDPIGTLGGSNLYAYVGNDPINGTDPTGLATVVIVGAPISSNPFGHVAIAVTGQGVYSYGTSQPFGSSLTDYLQQQGTYRGSTVIILDTTPEQEAAVVEAMNSYSGTKYSALTNNCATPVINALGSAGIGLDLMADGTAGPPNLPTTASNIATLQPGAVSTFLPKGASIPSELGQFDPGFAGIIPKKSTANANQSSSSTANLSNSYSGNSK